METNINGLVQTLDKALTKLDGLLKKQVVQDEEEDEDLSPCCAEPILNDIAVCSRCYEHC